MSLTEDQIATLATNVAALSAAKKLSLPGKWSVAAKSSRAMWGEIKGSGKNPYLAQIDLNQLAYKCSCPSRQFPCKHCLALLLLSATSPNSITNTDEEPDWVTDWIDKRQAKSEEKENKEQKELTPEEEEKRNKAKEKTQNSRIEGVLAGMQELELWLNDLIRTGLLELPAKSPAEFTKVASRMVDAKASGLASWINALGNLDYTDKKLWQDEALRIIANLYLLIRSFKNMDSLSPLWQATLKNMVGWSQSSKELLNDPEAEIITDTWLVAGQETEEVNDITVQRNWLTGVKTQKTALILNFATRFSSFESTIIPGSIIDAELAYFPSVTQDRAVIKNQVHLLNELPAQPFIFSSWEEILQHKSNLLAQNPWGNDILVILENAVIVDNNKSWMVCDSEKAFFPIDKRVELEKLLHWKILSGNTPSLLALIIRNNNILPLGIINNNKYQLLCGTNYTI